eukprot:SM000043S15833  [mRNA]  locus=s43:415710:421088:+ [translate_table: standard]
MPFTFPEITRKEILACMGDLEVPLSDGDLLKPTMEAIRPVYESVVTLLMGISREELHQPVFSAIDALEFPELHEESIACLAFNRAVTKLMYVAGVEDFTLRDLLGKRLLVHDVEAAGDTFIGDNAELRESPPKRRHADSVPSDSGAGAWEWPPSPSPQETASDGDRDVQSGLSPRDLLLQHPDASGRKPGPRRTAGPTTTQCIAARERRERITTYVRTLQMIVPTGAKVDTASVLEETIRYVRQLQHQIKGLLQEQSGPGGRDSNARPPRSPELLEAPAGGAATVSSGPGPAPPTTSTAAMEGGKTLTRSNSSDSSLE